MPDLSDICGDTPMRASFVKKRVAQQEKLEKLDKNYAEKSAPIKAEISMYDEMIAAIDKRTMQVSTAAPAPDDERGEVTFDECEKTAETINKVYTDAGETLAGKLFGQAPEDNETKTN